MDSAEQAAGEKQVRNVLIAGLEGRGLARPASLTKAQYDTMVKGLCERLAYMTDLNLAALEEQAASNPGGKDRDRMPIANRILEWAASIQPPEDSASPLMRAVFGHALGALALAEGWAPELLEFLREKRIWPTPYAVSMIKEKADPYRRRMTLIEEALTYGRDVRSEDNAFRDRRITVIRKCQAISDLSRGDV